MMARGPGLSTQFPHLMLNITQPIGTVEEVNMGPASQCRVLAVTRTRTTLPISVWEIKSRHINCSPNTSNTSNHEITSWSGIVLEKVPSEGS